MSAPDYEDPASKLKLKSGRFGKLWPKQLSRLARRYHTYLVAKAETEDLYFGSQGVAMPWFFMIFPLIAWGLIFQPSGPIWTGVILLTLAISLTGLVYASTVFFVQWHRIAKRRRSSDIELSRRDDR